MVQGIERLGYKVAYRTSDLMNRLIEYVFDIPAIEAGGRGAVYATVPILPPVMVLEKMVNQDLMDVIFHSNMSGAVGGYFSKKHGLKKGFAITMTAGIVFEIVEQILQIKGNEDWAKDLMTNFMGYVSYPIGEWLLKSVPNLQRRLRTYSERYKEKFMNSSKPSPTHSSAQ